MQRKVTIVMYHYVRDLQRSRYPEIKGLALGDFRAQLAYIKKYYAPITMEDLLRAAGPEPSELPSNAILLTFDDGYIDHFTNVYPVLDEEGLQGSFFPTARAVVEHKVLDVNKIQFILASVSDKPKIIEAIFSMLDEARATYDLEPNDVLFRRLAHPNRFDSGEVIFIKRSLQRTFPEELRTTIVERLFGEFVTRDEVSFATELYATADQLNCMCRNGMYVGSHGYDHVWLDTLEPAAQEMEIDKSLDFLKTLGCKTREWVMCYPYGGYNDSLVSIMRQKGCRIGLATHVDIANLCTENPLLLPRLDTNDLPSVADAEPNKWTRQVLTGQKE